MSRFTAPGFSRRRDRIPTGALRSRLHECYHPVADLDLTTLTEHELIALNRRIVERLRLMRSARHLEQLAHFSVGKRVEFTAADGRGIQGEITRLNRKTATVCCDAAGHWRVLPTLLRPLDASQDRPSHLQAFPPRR